MSPPPKKPGRCWGADGAGVVTREGLDVLDGDAGAEYEDPGGEQRAGGGHEHREDTAGGRCRQQHGLVAGDRRLR